MDDVVQALADPIRRELLRLLRYESATAGALASAFSVSRPAVSRHLRVLREAGLVRQRASGRERQYSAELAPLAELERYLAELSAPSDPWQQRFDALATEVHRVGRRRKQEVNRQPSKQKRKKTA